MTCSSCGNPFSPPPARGGRPRTRCDDCRSLHAQHDGKRWRDLRKRLLVPGIPCAICGVRAATELDHVIPLARGGAPYDLENLRPSCKSCNASKSARVRNFGTDEHPKPAAVTGMSGGPAAYSPHALDPCQCPPGCRCWVRPGHLRHWCL